MSRLVQYVAAAGFPSQDWLVHLFVGGSELHGAKVQGTDDMDIYGIYVEPPEKILGLEAFPHFVWSTAGNERRNTAHDVDITLYSLKKWAELACKGNPTALHFLFTQGEMRTPVWARIIAHREIFLSRASIKQFLGFADSQLKRMTGQLGRGKKGQRHELENEYGYDTKAGMHTLRLLYECEELATLGRITLPRPERDLLIQVRTGKFSMDRVISMAQKLMKTCEEAGLKSALPERADRKAVSKLIVECYLEAWSSKG